MFKYAHKSINKRLKNNIQLHFIIKHFTTTQCRVLCPHNHVTKDKVSPSIFDVTAGGIRVLSSYRLVGLYLLNELINLLSRKISKCFAVFRENSRKLAKHLAISREVSRKITPTIV